MTSMVADDNEETEVVEDTAAPGATGSPGGTYAILEPVLAVPEPITAKTVARQESRARKAALAPVVVETPLEGLLRKQASRQRILLGGMLIAIACSAGSCMLSATNLVFSNGEKVALLIAYLLS